MTDQTIIKPAREHAATRQASMPAPISSWAVPTEADEATWETMTREQQLAAMQSLFNSSACTTPTESTVADILTRSRAKRAAAQAADARKL